MKYKAIIFDLFGTLVGQFPLDQIEKSLSEMASTVGLDYETFFNAWAKDIKFKRHTGEFPSLREEIRWICNKKNVTPTNEALDKAI